MRENIEASYLKPKERPENINGYRYDEDLSSPEQSIYSKDGHAIYSHRGTQGAKDWLNNASYATGAYKLTNRYKRDKDVT